MKCNNCILFHIAKEVSVDFENFSKAELDTKLRSFYAELRNTKRELYKRTSLLSNRSGIGRHCPNSMHLTLLKILNLSRPTTCLPPC